MAGDSWDERRRALEDSFYMQLNNELLNDLREHLSVEENKQAISAASGISNDVVLELLVAVGISGETIAALSLVPLVVVAWADGKMADAERKAILEAAASEGIGPESLCYQLLDGWLEEGPAEQLLHAWQHYVRELVSRLGPESAAKFQDEVIGRARKVASAAGGVLGLSSISKAEQDALDQLTAAFAD